MPETNLDVKEIIINKITEEIQSLLNAEPTFYNGYNVVITNERQFVPTKVGKKPKSIFLVIKFLDGSKDLGQQRQPFSINVLSEYNTLGVCQQLLMDFAETYNLIFEVNNTDYTIKQMTNSPVVVGSFNEVFEGYRATFYLTGSFLIGINSNPITNIHISGSNDLEEDIEFISAQMIFDAQPDSQPFFGTNNFNRTVVKVGTLSIGFSMYALNSEFYNSALDIAFNYSPDTNINRTYTLTVSLANGREYTVPMKLTSLSGIQELRDFPAVSVTFVR